MTHFYIARHKHKTGPFTLDEVNQALQEEKIEPTDLIWFDGLAHWLKIEEFSDRQPSLTNDMVTTALKQQSIVQSLAIQSRAKVRSRILAKLIDWGLFLALALPIVLSVVLSPDYDTIKPLIFDSKLLVDQQKQLELLSVIPQRIMLLTNYLLAGLIIGQVVLILQKGQSIGKWLMKIKVVNQNTNTVPSYVRLLWIRTLLVNVLYTLSILGLIFFLVDLLMLLFTKTHRSLHDRLTKTQVIRIEG